MIIITGVGLTKTGFESLWVVMPRITISAPKSQIPMTTKTVRRMDVILFCTHTEIKVKMVIA